MDCQVDWIKGCLPKTFPCGSLRVFLKEINVWFSRLSKAILPPQCGWALSNPLTALIKQKGKGRKILSLSSWAGTPIFSCRQTWELLFLGLRIPGLMPVALKFSGLRPQTRVYTNGFLGSQAFRFRLKSATLLLWPSGFWTTSTTPFLGLWLIDNRLLDFSACITVCQFFTIDHTYTHVLLVPFPSRTLANMLVFQLFPYPALIDFCSSATSWKSISARLCSLFSLPLFNAFWAS